MAGKLFLETVGLGFKNQTNYNIIFLLTAHISTSHWHCYFILIFAILPEKNSRKFVQLRRNLQAGG